jgi:succinate dehydrogenase flavin-adding protein (antitoxin of CptAB toxin-antitoxin module)
MDHLASASDGLPNNPAIRRRRLLFRCLHRGIREIDFGSFAETVSYRF